MKPITMSIDPSINNLGVAIFKGKKLVHAELLHPLKEAKAKELQDKCSSLYLQLYRLRQVWDVSDIVLEWPDHWAIAGFMSRESGAIYKVTFMSGMLYALKYTVKTFTLTYPRGWKGQLTKDAVRNRLRSVYVPKYYTKQEWKDLDHNILDAIGIGHWKLYGRV